MDKMISYDAILFPADERAPHLVPLMTSNASSFSQPGQSSQQPQPAMGRIPHPEMYMNFIAEGVGPRAWRSHVSFHIPLALSPCIHSPPAFHLPYSKFFLSHVHHRLRSDVNDDHALPHFSLRPFPDSPNANQKHLSRARPFIPTLSE